MVEKSIPSLSSATSERSRHPSVGPTSTAETARMRFCRQRPHRRPGPPRERKEEAKPARPPLPRGRRDPRFPRVPRCASAKASSPSCDAPFPPRPASRARSRSLRATPTTPPPTPRAISAVRRPPASARRTAPTNGSAVHSMPTRSPWPRIRCAPAISRRAPRIRAVGPSRVPRTAPRGPSSTSARTTTI